MNVTVRDLLDAGVHFGHQRKRWNPRSKDFVFDHRHGVSIIDLEKTHKCLEKAYRFLEDMAGSDKTILLVGTKRQAQELIREAAEATNMPFCASRWLGGTLTNFETIKRSIAKYKKYLAMEADGSLSDLPGKELAMIKREMSRMNRNFEGIQEMGTLPGALFIVDIKHETIAVEEAKRLNIPVIAIVDTNSDPSRVDYPIPGNDDAAKSLRIMVDTVAEAIQSGLSQRESRRASKHLTAASRAQVSQEAAARFVSGDDEVRIEGEALAEAPARQAAVRPQADVPQAAEPQVEEPAAAEKAAPKEEDHAPASEPVAEEKPSEENQELASEPAPETPAEEKKE